MPVSKKDREKQSRSISRAEGLTVTKVRFSASKRPHYLVYLVTADGEPVRTSTSFTDFARSVCRNLGMKITSNAARRAVGNLRAKVSAAIEEFERDPKAAAKVAAARAAHTERILREEVERIRLHREKLRSEILERVLEMKMTLEEVTDVWRESVAVQVMES